LSDAVSPLRRRACPFGPSAISVYDWEATAPTPDSTYGQPAPTNGQQLWIAIPNRPLTGSRATIEYVMDLLAHLDLSAWRHPGHILGRPSS
jgi:hypothetical protein